MTRFDEVPEGIENRLSFASVEIHHQVIEDQWPWSSIRRHVLGHCKAEGQADFVLGFSVEPGIYLPEFGVRLEIDVYVDPIAGPRVTTPVQNEPILLA